MYKTTTIAEYIPEKLSIFYQLQLDERRKLASIRELQ